MRRYVLLFETIIIMLVLSSGICLSQGIDNAVNQNKESSKEKKQGVFPNIKFDELSFDFGKVSQNETLKHTFIFRNTGTETLNIGKVKAG